MLQVFLSPREALPSHPHVIEFKLYIYVFCTRQKSLFNIDDNKQIQMRTRGKLHHTQAPALDRLAISTKLPLFLSYFLIFLEMKADINQVILTTC